MSVNTGNWHSDSLVRVHRKTDEFFFNETSQVITFIFQAVRVEHFAFVYLRKDTNQSNCDRTKDIGSRRYQNVFQRKRFKEKDWETKHLTTTSIIMSKNTKIIRKEGRTNALENMEQELHALPLSLTHLSINISGLRIWQELYRAFPNTECLHSLT